MLNDKIIIRGARQHNLKCIDIDLPRDLDVRVTCHSGGGSVECPSGLDHGADGPGGPVLTLDVRSGVGSVAVTR